MKKILLAAACCSFYCTTSAQVVKQDYVVAITKFQKWYNEKNADSLYAMFSPTVKSALPLDKTHELLESLNGQFGQLKSTQIAKDNIETTTYKGTFEKTKLNIVMALNEKKELVNLLFQPVSLDNADPSNFNIQTEKGATIYGTLVMPEGKTKPNVVLMIAGSGPTDRNCNNAQGVGTNAFKMLADSLRKEGIASIRFDKRGVGESAEAVKEESELRFEDMARDVEGFVKKIKADNRFGKIFIAGHSEGSLVGLVAANKTPVDGFISIAGAGESADKILSKQIKTNLTMASADAEKILKDLKNGKTVTVENKYLQTLFNPSVQPYLISWFAYNPQLEIKKINVPVLILQGSTDLQVTEADAKLLSDAQPKAKLVIIKEMNHVLKPAGADRKANLATYNSPELGISSGLVREIVQFCN